MVYPLSLLRDAPEPVLHSTTVPQPKLVAFFIFFDSEGELLVKSNFLPLLTATLTLRLSYYCCFFPPPLR